VDIAALSSARLLTEMDLISNLLIGQSPIDASVYDICFLEANPLSENRQPGKIRRTK